MPEHSSLERGRARRLLVLAVVCFVLLGVLYALAIHTEWGQRIDDAAFDGRTNRESVISATNQLIDTISVTTLALGTIGIMVVALARRRPHLALTAAVIIGGSNVTSQLLKKSILDRPDLLGRVDVVGMENSFPSGHSTVAMSVAVALVIVVPAAARPWAGLGGLVYATLVGAGTVTAGQHRPSDVLGAYLVVGAWAGASVAVLIWAEGAERARPSELLRRVPALSPFLAGIGTGVLLGAIFGVAGTLLAVRTDELDAVRLEGSYAASIAAIAAFALLLMVALLAALRDLSLDPPHEVAAAPATA